MLKDADGTCSQPPNKIKDRYSSLEIDAVAKITHSPVILRFIPHCLTGAIRGKDSPSFGWWPITRCRGQWATPERIAKELKDLKPDIVLLSEVPKTNRGKKVKDWSRRLADALGLDHVHVGTVSSAGHKSPNWGDPTGNYGGKFKSILSRTLLTGGMDISVEGSGWKRASAVRAETEIDGRKFALYSLHLPGFAHHKRQPVELSAWEGSKHKALADHINAEKESYNVIVGGDFNEWTEGLVMKSMLKETKMKMRLKRNQSTIYSTVRGKG